MPYTVIDEIEALLKAGWLKVKIIRDAKYGGISYHDAVLEREDDESLTLVVNINDERR